MKEFVEIPSGGWTLHGIVHQPAQIHVRRVGVVIVVGPNTKFGTHRLFFQLADQLAHAGFYVLRYDNRGTWDSPGVRDLTFADRVADARAAVAFFRRQYRLESVLGWGLCLGAVVGLHYAVEAITPEEILDGLVLCNPLLSYSSDLQSAARNVFTDGSPARRFWKMLSHRENWTKKGPALLRRYLLQRRSEADVLGAAVRRMGELMLRYDRAILLIFGEKDRHWSFFRDQVNPDDRLGLARKKLPLAWAFVEDGDHTFSSREQTAAVLRYTLDWVKPFLQGSEPGPVHSTLQLWQHNTATETAWR